MCNWFLGVAGLYLVIALRSLLFTCLTGTIFSLVLGFAVVYGAPPILSHDAFAMKHTFGTVEGPVLNSGWKEAKQSFVWAVEDGMGLSDQRTGKTWTTRGKLIGATQLSHLESDSGLYDNAAKTWPLTSDLWIDILHDRILTRSYTSSTPQIILSKYPYARADSVIPAENVSLREIPSVWKFQNDSLFLSIHNKTFLLKMSESDGVHLVSRDTEETGTDESNKVLFSAFTDETEIRVQGTAELFLIKSSAKGIETEIPFSYPGQFVDAAVSEKGMLIIVRNDIFYDWYSIRQVQGRWQCEREADWLQVIYV